VERVEVLAGPVEHPGQVRQDLVVQGGEQVVQSVLAEMRHHQEVVAVNLCAVDDGLQLEYSPVRILRGCISVVEDIGVMMSSVQSNAGKHEASKEDNSQPGGQDFCKPSI